MEITAKKNFGGRVRIGKKSLFLHQIYQFGDQVFANFVLISIQKHQKNHFQAIKAQFTAKSSKCVVAIENIPSHEMTNMYWKHFFNNSSTSDC